MLLLEWISGCASGATPTVVPISCTVTPEPPTATPTLEPTVTAVLPTGTRVLTWERDLAEGCQTVIVDAQGQASFGPCSDPNSVAPILSGVERPRDLQHFLDRYQPFEAETPAGRIVFAGRGTRVATPSEQRALAEWASIVHQELEFGRSGASWGMAIALNQEGANPCSRVQIEIYSKVFANDCRVGIKPYPHSWLTAEQIDHLYAWIDKFQVFEINWNEGGIPLRLVFGGRGSQPATESNQSEILAWVNEMIATPTSMSQPPVTIAPTSSSGVPPSTYEDSWLCFTVEVPAGWATDGVPGGFASFAPATGQPSFRITNVALETTTLAQALANVQRGPLGSHIQEVKDFAVGGQSAWWVTFAPGAEFQFVVLVIAPDCGDGPHALFISATRAEQRSFETFLNHIRFTSEATPEVPSIPPQPTPENPIGGGTVESGPFTFTLLLYQDDTLSPTTDLGPWAYSDLPGVGWYIGWVYHGPLLQGPISELWSTRPDVESRVGRDKLQEGDHGGRAGGGVLLPGTSQVGDTVRLVTKVQTPHGSYGAALRFILRQGPDGFEPTNISVEALPSPSPTVAEILAEGGKVPFEVCGQSTTWVRPSEEEQGSKWGAGRYAGVNEEVTKYPWTHNFFVVYGGASIEYDIENLSGLWTLEGGERAKCFEPERHDAILKLQTAEVWSLLHKVSNIKRLGTSYAIVVEPTQQGVQFVQFPRPTEWLPLTLYFVTSDGEEVEKIVEADYIYWPYPQLVPTPQSPMAAMEILRKET